MNLTKEENIELLDDFYHLYLRSPKFYEYKKLGGNLKRTAYLSLLSENYFDEPKGKEETYEVVNTRNEIVYIGMLKDIANEYDVKYNHIKGCYSKGVKMKREYTLRKREFNVDYFNKHRKDDYNE